MKLLSGDTLKGSISTWDFEAVEGTFGRVPWSHFRPEDANRLCKKLLNWRQASQYIGLARMLFALEGADKLAEAALADALRRDRNCADEVESLREHVARHRRDVVEARRIAAEREFQSKAVGRSAAGEASAKPGAQVWSVATDRERVEALSEMKADADRWLRQVKLRYSVVEGKYWVLYADAPIDQAKELARRMDDLYESVARLFALPDGLNIFHGKGVVIVSGTQENYRAIEMAAFNAMPPPGAIGLCHMVGPKVVVSANKGQDDLRFMATLAHEATHGFMHRYGSPSRLPSWADEGYAEFVAAQSIADSPATAERRAQGLKWLRDANNKVESVLGMSYEDGSWPGADAIGYAVGFLAVDFLARGRPEAFREWVKDVKAGVAWEDAMKNRFGWSRAQLAQAITERYWGRD